MSEHAAFLNWLAGFIDGEGSFQIKKNGELRFSLALRHDDVAILEEIARRTGLGKVAYRQSCLTRTSKPQSRWEIWRRADAVALCDILRKHPLRAKKARDFEIWAEGVNAWTMGTFDKNYRMALRDRLREVREYREEPISMVDVHTPSLQGVLL